MSERVNTAEMTREQHIHAGHALLSASRSGPLDPMLDTLNATHAVAHFLAAEHAPDVVKAEAAPPAEPIGWEALIDSDGDVWRKIGDDRYRLYDGTHVNSRNEIQDRYGSTLRVRIIELDD